MGVPLPVEFKVDERSATAAAARAEKVFKDAGQGVSRAFTDAAGDADRAMKKIADSASDAYDKAKDAAGRLHVEEKKLQDLREKGANNTRIVDQAEKVEKARRAEIRAIRDATDAYADYEAAAAKAGESSAAGFAGGFRGALGGLASAGQEAAGGFAEGFAGASAIGRLGMAGGPIGLALAGVAALGVAAGKVLGSAIADGMATIQLQDQFQARMGIDDASMGRFAAAAGQAYAHNFGQSVADNLATAQAAIQTGLLDPGAGDAEAQQIIQQLQGVASVTDATAAQLSRSIQTLMRNGVAGSVRDASDIIVAGFQEGLDVSGDWLDTINEYSTQFRKFGLDGAQVLTLLKQGMEGGARDTDKVADSLKEFSIRAVDGSKLTKEGFEALGFNADEMGRRFAEGGESSRVVLDAVFEGLRKLDDPQQKALVWAALFGTQFEDMGDAINKLDLSPAENKFDDLAGTSDKATKTATDNFKSEWEEATKTVGQFFADLKTDVAEWFVDLPLIKDIPKYLTTIFRDRTPITPTGQDPTTGQWTNSNGQNWSDLMLPPGVAQPPQGVTAPPIVATPQAPANPFDPGFGANGLPGIFSNLDRNGKDTVAPPVAGAPTPMQTASEAQAAKDAEKAKPNIDPSRYSLDSVGIGSFGGIGTSGIPGGVPAVGVPQVTSGAPQWDPQKQAYGYMEVDQQKIYDAQTSEISSRQSVENARLKLLELEAEGTATAGELNQARTAVVTSERQYQSTLMKLAEAQQGTWKKMESTAKSFTGGMDDIGAALDNDLGISEGLPGLADNLVRFLANLGFAPMMGKLAAISAANPNQGSGMLGWAASNGMFGAQYTPAYANAQAQQGIPGYTPGYSGSFPWDAVAKAESSGDWSNNNTGGHMTSSGAPKGGLQITDGTWASFGGTQFAPSANLASREQQITVAERIAWDGYNGTPPQGLGAWEAITKGMVPGVTVNTPRGTPGTATTAAPGATGVSGAPSEAQVKSIAAAFGLQVTSEDRPGETGSYHSKGMALDLSNGSGNTPQQRQFADYMAANFGPFLKELIYSDGSFNQLIGDGKNVTGTGYYSAGTLSEHQNHVHVAAAWGDGTAVPGAAPPAAAGAYASMPSTGGTVPVLVTNWPAAGAAVTVPGAAAPAATANTGGGTPANTPATPTVGVPPATATVPPLTGGTGPGAAAFGPGGPPASLPGLGGIPFPALPGGGGIGFGGAPMDAAMTAMSGLDALAPGAGAAAQTGMKLANRAIQYGGQVAGIGVSGALETLLPAGSPLASIGNSWFGKLAAGFAGARPALPNIANKQAQAPSNGSGTQAAPGNTQNIELNYTNQQAPEDRAGADIVRNLEAVNTGAGMR